MTGPFPWVPVVERVVDEVLLHVSDATVVAITLQAARHLARGEADLVPPTLDVAGACEALLSRLGQPFELDSRVLYPLAEEATP